MEQRPHFDAEPASSTEKDTTKKKRRVVLPTGVVPEVEKPAPAPEPEKLEKPEQPTPSIVPKLETHAAPKSDQKEADDAAQEDKILETLDASERQKAAQEYVAAVLPEVAAEVERTSPDSREAVESAADAAFLQELQNRLPHAETPEQAADEAFQSVAETLGTEKAAEDSEKQKPSDKQEEPDAEQAGEETAEETPEDPVSVNTASQASSVTHATPMPFAPVSPASLPPIVRPPHAGGRAFTPSSSGPNVLPAAAAANMAARSLTPAEAFRRERGARASGLIVGGLLGYFLGRRRGRIKTEKKLLPVQEKLKKEVKSLHENIAEKEEKIRTLAAQKSETAAALQTKQETVKKLREVHTKAKTAEVIAASAVATQEIARTKPAANPETLIAATSAEQIASPMTTEVTTRQVEQMAMPQLLVVAESIKVDNVSVRKMYESRQLDEQSVRRIVQEHVRGHNTHEAVARELIAKESPFEKDPFARPRIAAQQNGAGAAEMPTYRTADSDVLPNPLRPAITTSGQSRLATKNHTAAGRRTATIGIGVIIAIGLAIAMAAIIG